MTKKSVGAQAGSRVKLQGWEELWEGNAHQNQRAGMGRVKHLQGERVTNVAFSASQTVSKAFLRFMKFICCSYSVKEMPVLQGI